MTRQQFQLVSHRAANTFYSVLLCALLLLLVLVLLATLPFEGSDNWRRPQRHSTGSEPVNVNL